MANDLLIQIPKVNKSSVPDNSVMSHSFAAFNIKLKQMFARTIFCHYSSIPWQL